MNKMKVRIFTDAELVYDSYCSSVSIPGFDGSYGIMKNHENSCYLLSSGKIIINDDNQKTYFPVTGGTAICRNGELTVLSEYKEQSKSEKPDR